MAQPETSGFQAVLPVPPPARPGAAPGCSSGSEGCDPRNGRVPVSHRAGTERRRFLAISRQGERAAVLLPQQLIKELKGNVCLCFPCFQLCGLIVKIMGKKSTLGGYVYMCQSKVEQDNVSGHQHLMTLYVPARCRGVGPEDLEG